MSTAAEIQAEAAEWRARIMAMGEPELQRPTVPGKVEGIVSVEPMVLQCRDCGRTLTAKTASTALFIMVSGWHFHRCEGRAGVRRCRDCLDHVKAECPLGGCRS